MTTSAPVLEASRTRADPLADALVQRLFDLGGSDAVDAFMRHLVSHDHLPTSLPHSVVAAMSRDEGASVAVLDADIDRFLVESSRPPATFEVDQDQLRWGQEIFLESGVLSLVSLLHASLPACYLLKNGAEVLGVTAQLERHTFRRILETAQMVVASMGLDGVYLAAREDGSATLAGPGVAEAQKVRVLHAAVRHMLLRPGDVPDVDAEAGGLVSTGELAAHMARRAWDSERLGAPINQMDMAYTLLTFGLVIPQSLVKLGVPLSPQGQEAVLHTWNVLGCCMGVEEGLMVHDLDSATRLLETIQTREGGSSRNGQRLTHALHDCIAGVLPFRWLRWLPHVLMRTLLGREHAVALGVPEPRAAENLGYALLHGFISGIARIEIAIGGSSRLIKRLYIEIGKSIIAGLAALPRPGEGEAPRGRLDLSDHHRRAWGLHDT